jgi:hypothetical protein
MIARKTVCRLDDGADAVAGDAGKQGSESGPRLNAISETKMT